MATIVTSSLLHVRSPIPSTSPLFVQRLRLRRSASASQRLHLLPRGLPTATPRATAEPSASSAVDEVSVAEGVASAIVLLDVSGMKCGGCAARVRSILAADARVENVAVNLLAESAAVRLRSPAQGAGEELAARLTDCGFPTAARRGGAAAGAAESARKWTEMAARKAELLTRSRGRVAFAWTLVALCCGSHASHLLHSFGIHVGHGSFFDLLHNSYVKCGIAMVALFGPGRDILFDGLRAFKQGSPNMNSLVGFGSAAAFAISAVSLLNPELAWNSTFFDEPVEDAQAREAPIQRLADSIAGPFVYTVMTLSAATFSFWYYMGTHIFPEVLLNDISGPDQDSLLLSLKLAVDVLLRIKKNEDIVYFMF